VYFRARSVLYGYMDVKETTPAASTLAGVPSPPPSPEEIAAASMSRLRIEIIRKYGTIKAFHEHIHSIGLEGLKLNLNNKSDMRLSVFYECLALLDMDQAEFARRVLQDVEDLRRNQEARTEP
jgi:hypothetical protein